VTVRLHLPRYVGEDAASASSGGRSHVQVGAGEAVLVVDDEASVRMFVNEVLGELGYCVHQAEDASAALKVLESDLPLALLITDVGLPGGMNGRQLADAARVARPKLKILFITGYAENAALSERHLMTGAHILTKPFSLETLGARVTEIIAAVP
jgi:CheY-like chemotaxis protein